MDPLITVAEADSFLKTKDDWMLLDDTNKAAHIMEATYIIAGNWSCPNIDWADSTTWTTYLTDEIKDAAARLAYYDSQQDAGAFSPNYPEGQIKREKLYLRLIL